MSVNCPVCALREICGRWLMCKPIKPRDCSEFSDEGTQLDMFDENKNISAEQLRKEQSERSKE